MDAQQQTPNKADRMFAIAETLDPGAWSIPLNRAYEKRRLDTLKRAKVELAFRMEHGLA